MIGATYDPTLGRTWIAPELPSDAELARLREAVTQPGVLRAWLGGMAFTRSGEIQQVQQVVAIVVVEPIDFGTIVERLPKDIRARWGWFRAGVGEIGRYEPPGLQEHGLALTTS